MVRATTLYTLTHHTNINYTHAHPHTMRVNAGSYPPLHDYSTLLERRQLPLDGDWLDTCTPTPHIIHTHTFTRHKHTLLHSRCCSTHALPHKYSLPLSGDICLSMWSATKHLTRHTHAFIDKCKCWHIQKTATRIPYSR